MDDIWSESDVFKRGGIPMNFGTIGRLSKLKAKRHMNIGLSHHVVQPVRSLNRWSGLQYPVANLHQDPCTPDEVVPLYFPFLAQISEQTRRRPQWPPQPRNEPGVFARAGRVGTTTYAMTLQGTVAKTAILLLVLLIAAAYTWSQAIDGSPIWPIGMLIGADYRWFSWSPW